MSMSLQKRYEEIIVPQLCEEFGFTNPMTVPSLVSCTLNIGVGDSDKKVIQMAYDGLMQLSGQRPIITKSRKSVAGFKIRAGWPLGVKVTLRGDQMYAFLERTLWIAFPRVRDFSGLNPKSFDGRGNYNFGIKEHYVFPEIVYEDLDRHWGLDIALATSATNNEHGFALLKALGFPFKGHIVKREEGK